VLASLQAALPPSLFAFMSNDLDGLPIFAAASFTNFARVNVQGAEASLQYFQSDRLVADLGYSRLVFSPKGGVSPEVISANAPANSMTAGMTYTFRKLSTSLRYRWSDRFIWSGGALSGPIPAFQVVDMTVSYQVGRRTTVLANVTNLLDNEHYEIFGGDILRRRALVSLRQIW
jgi:outer membrane receptor protein involved in Fe transport